MSTAFSLHNDDETKVLTRVDALEIIVRKSCDRDLDNKPVFGKWEIIKF